MDKFTAKLPQYLEDGLTEIESIELENHLADCAVCQAEFDALTRFDQLLAVAPMVTPSPAFVTTVSAKLERRLHRRRTVMGISVITVLLILFSGAFLWNFVDSGVTIWQWLNDGVLWQVSLDVWRGLVIGGATVLKIVLVIFTAFTKLLHHPALWGYVSVSVGIVWLWVQMLRRLELTRQHISIQA